MPNEFHELQEQLARYDHEAYLGRLVWFTISEQAMVPHKEFCAALIEEHIDYVLPPFPRPSDVFKRVCTAAKQKKVPTSDPNIALNYNLVDGGKDNDSVWRLLVREEVDTENHVLSETQLATIHFDRRTSHITSTTNVKALALAELHIISDIEQRFDEITNRLTPQSIRYLIVKLLNRVNAVPVRPSGGVYFVRETHGALVESLERIISALPQSSLHSLPLLDDSKQRQMLRQAFEDDSIGQIDNMLGDMKQLLQAKKKITSDRFADYKVEADRLKEKVGEYSDLLDTAMVETASRIEILNEVLFQLMGNIKI